MENQYCWFPPGLGLLDRNWDEEKCLTYLLLQPDGVKKISTQTPRPESTSQPGPLPSLQPHSFDWEMPSLKSLSDVFSLLYLHCFRVLGSVFLPRTIVTAFSMVAVLVSPPSSLFPWCLQKSKCSLFNSSGSTDYRRTPRPPAKCSKDSTNWSLPLRITFQRHTLYSSHAKQFEA